MSSSDGRCQPSAAIAAADEDPAPQVQGAVSPAETSKLSITGSLQAAARGPWVPPAVEGSQAPASPTAEQEPPAVAAQAPPPAAVGERRSRRVVRHASTKPAALVKSFFKGVKKAFQAAFQ